MSTTRIRCPKCDWEPAKLPMWMCSCRHKWNTFDTAGQCPACGKTWADTQCLSCHNFSPHTDWYETIETPKPKEKEKFVWFWQKDDKPPITGDDRLWLEENLLWLAELFTPEVFLSMKTVTPDKQYFDRHFTGTEEDVEFILEKVAAIMNIKLWEIQLMFFSDEPIKFSAGITATPSKELKGGWTSKGSELVDKGFGNKEIWISMGQMNDPIGLIATISTELGKYKLQSEYAIDDDVDILADIAAMVYGFGIFKGNSYFKFAQWQGNSRYGWQMQKRGGLPEPVIAYIMAWLAYHRNEDTGWKQYLNKTMKKHFEQSYKYIEENWEKIKWE